jgi:hypothetical protein
MQPVADALFERKITNNPLPLVPFSEWLEKLKVSAKDMSEENMKRVVRVFQWLGITSAHLVFDYSLL